MLNRWMNSKTNYELKEQNTMSEIEWKTQSSATEREGGGGREMKIEQRMLNKISTGNCEASSL